MDADRVLLVPRWGGTIDQDFYPWLAGHLGEPPLQRLPLPDREAPTPAGCVEAFSAALDAGDPARTLCIGHSVSVQGWLRTFAARPERRVGALVAVAGWWTVDEPWPSILPWLETPDCDAIRRACPDIHVLISDDDPFTSDAMGNARLWEERLGAQVSIVSRAAHFNRVVEPEVLAVVQAVLG